MGLLWENREAVNPADGAQTTQGLELTQYLATLQGLALAHMLESGRNEHEGTAMKTTCEFLDAVKARHNLPSDYSLAKKLGISTGGIGNYRAKRSYMDDLTAFKVAELLEIDPAIVVAAANSERAKKPEEIAVWESILQKLGGAAALVLIGVGGISAPSPAQASTQSIDEHNVYYVKRRKRNKFASFSGILRALSPSAPFQAT